MDRKRWSGETKERGDGTGRSLLLVGDGIQRDERVVVDSRRPRIDHNDCPFGSITKGNDVPGCGAYRRAATLEISANRQGEIARETGGLTRMMQPVAISPRATLRAALSP
jgi:hypothetical protein